MPVDALELQIVSALQRFTRLRQSADNIRSESHGLATRVLTELETALEELRVAQDQLVENRSHMERLQTELTGPVRQVLGAVRPLMPASVCRHDAGLHDHRGEQGGRRAVQRQPAVSDRQDPPCVRLRGSRASPDRGLPAVRAAGVGGAGVQDAAAGARAAVDVSARVSGDTRSLRWLIRTLPPSNGAHAARPL